MIKWLRFFFLGFFSDKISKEGARRGYLNLALSFILALCLLFCGLMAADMAPFRSHYNNSEPFRRFLYNAFASENRINLKTLDGTVSAETDGGFSAALVADTYTSEEDRAKYSLGGYNLVVDTRPSTVYDDFEAYCVAGDGTEITYADYLALTDAEKSGYEFKVRYTRNELILTEQLSAEHESYLAGLQSGEHYESYLSLAAKKGELSSEEYGKELYALYIKAYYPGLTEIPLLRNYYYYNYLGDGTNGKFLFLFDDTCIGSFVTDGGLAVTFYGYYGGAENGILIGEGADEAQAQKSVDDFFVSAFHATASLSAYVYVMNLIRMIPFVLFMPIVVALIAFCVLRLLKSDWGKKYGECLKIVGAYMLVSSLLAAVVALIGGFFVQRNALFAVILVAFFAILLVRTCASLVIERVKLKKSAQAEEKIGE